ncbi:B-box type zinc finger protein ncl-1-like [Watersipora subatra]|uniref:B-box type zinc finger protein ncl-1-like n=1 Tax=Watersipora subatra TaxID=2589382 RepID=UPI00355BDD2D
MSSDAATTPNLVERKSNSEITSESMRNGEADATESNAFCDEMDGMSLTGDVSGLALYTCPECLQEYKLPRVLNCLHVFCEDCLKPLLKEDNLSCPMCGMNTEVDSVEELPLDYVIANSLDMKGIEGMNMSCTSCKAKEKAISRCSDCAQFLCPNCVTAHQFMRCFENHKVVSFEDITKGDGLPIHRPIICYQHSEEQLMKNFCNSCEILICNDCMLLDHQGHDIERCSSVHGRELESMKTLVEHSKVKVEQCDESSTKLQQSLTDLETQHDDAKSLIQETFQSYKASLEQRQESLLAQLEVIHKQQELAVLEKYNEVNKTVDKIEHGSAFVQRIIEKSDCLEFLALKKVMNQYLSSLVNLPLSGAVSVDIRFVTDKEVFEKAVTDSFGHFKLRDENVLKNQQQQQQLQQIRQAERQASRANLASEVKYNTSPPLLMPSGSFSDMSRLPPVSSVSNMDSPLIQPIGMENDMLNAYHLPTSDALGYPDQFGLKNTSGGLNFIGEHVSGNHGHSKPQSPTMGSDSGIGIESTGSPGTQAHSNPPQASYSVSDIGKFTRAHSTTGQMFHDQSISRAGANILSPSPDQDLRNSMFSPTSMGSRMSNPAGISALESVLAQRRESGSLNLATGSGNNSGFTSPTPNMQYQPQFPLRGKMSAMQIRYKFGALGPSKGQFNSPHGFCMGFEEDIVVADTNNHRIQVFDKSGEFKYQFGIPGREEGQLWYPRKVAVMRGASRYVICDRGNERSRMQIFSKNGHFVKKIAIRYIDIVAGLAITPAGNIVAVDSVSPTVFTISEGGDLIKWFDCSDYMREPSDIAVADKEYYVCDFKGHCVVVFNDDGQFLRRIGTDTITNFPNGIDISDAGDVLVGDSHGNRFHVAVFQRDGSLIGEFECPYVKVSRCCGLKITSEGYVVTLAKNNHHVLVLNTLYIS